MLNLPPVTTSLTGTPRHFDMSHRLAQKIANIAGIGAGDRVFYCGVPDQAIDVIVTGLGARFIGGGAILWPGMARHYADIALGWIPAEGAEKAIVRLRLVRRRLRPGGRLVMWTGLGREHSVSEVRDPFLRLAKSVGFTSMIVGQWRSEERSKVVVATGILNK